MRRPGAREDSEGGIDLFDDPPWDSRPDGRSPLAWLGHLAFVLFLAVLALLGLVVVIAVVSFVWLIAGGLHFSIGNIDITPPDPSSSAMDIVLSADGTRAYLSEPNNNRLLVVDTASGRLFDSVTVGSDPTGLALTPDGSEIWVVNTTLSSLGGNAATASSATAGGPSPGSSTATTVSLTAGSVSVVSTATGQLLGTVDVGAGPIDVAFSPDGRTAYVTNNGFPSSGSVSVIDTHSLSVVGTLAMPPAAGPSGSNPTSVAVSPDGKQVWVSEVDDLEASTGSAGSADDVVVFDAASATPVATIPVGTGPFFLTLSRDGRDAYVADKLSCDVKEIDTARLTVVGTVPWPATAGCPFGIAAGPVDGLVYTVTGSDQSFNEANAGRAFGSVDFGSGQARVAARIGRDPVTVALSPDGKTAYVVDARRQVIELVDPVSGSIRGTFSVPD